jgi:cytochrome c-type biogenesis protein CcsB
MDRESGRIFEREQKQESDPSHRTIYERAVVKLQNALTVYRRLKNSVKPESVGDFRPELVEFQKAIEPGVAAYRAQGAGRDHNTNDLNRLGGYLEQYEFLSRIAYPLIVPPHHPEEERDNWMNVGAALMESVRGHTLHNSVTHYAAMLDAYRHGETNKFNQAVAGYQASLEPKLGKEIAKGRSEFFFSDYAFFYKAINIYVFAFLLACASWFFWGEPLRRSAHWLMALAFVIHTIGLIYRMVLEGRPPVTNLYSSAVFIGWGLVLFCLFLERIFPLAIATAVATLGGFLTLIIAHGLAMGGDDTMKMLQAVLDTNFWLATHVVTITIGYSATFLAGLLAIAYVVLGLFTRKLNGTVGDSETGNPSVSKTSSAKATQRPQLTINQAIGKMVYGIICFATLFSFVGTVLGGIWADQSWGRFWGWDPKENGALIIVLWNAIILHARWGGLIRERGLMNLAIFGNVVTAFSWFGVNMLGIGLHSYGFMDAAFKWLMIFNASQCFLIALGLLPERYWRSFRTIAAPSSPTPPTPHGQPVPVGK